MKKLFFLFVFLGASFLFVSCEDDAVTLTINTSAYDVVKDLKDGDGNLYFTGKLEDGLQLRISFLVVKEAWNSAEIVSRGEYYLSDINSIASYTTEELEPGIYNVMVTSDFIKDGKEYNTIAVNTQYSGLKVNCKESAGVYNAFGAAHREDILVEKKTEITLNTQRKGSLVTVLFTNAGNISSKKYKVTLTNFVYNAYGKYDNEFTNNTGSLEYVWTTPMEYAQHYCASTGYVMTDFGVITGNGGGYSICELQDGKDVVVELDLTAERAVLK